MSRAVIFFWRGPGQDVRLTGTFCQWAARGLPMEAELPGLFSLQLQLPVGTSVQFKFIVDGAWRVDPTSPTVTDSQGNENNELYVAAQHPGLTPVRGSSGSSHEVSGSAVGTPGYCASGEAGVAEGMPVGSAMLAAVPGLSLDPTSTSYIGAGVLREYTEEYELDAGRYGVAQRRALPRSHSMSQLERPTFAPVLLRAGSGDALAASASTALQASHHRASFTTPAASSAAEEQLQLLQHPPALAIDESSISSSSSSTSTGSSTPDTRVGLSLVQQQQQPSPTAEAAPGALSSIGLSAPSISGASSTLSTPRERSSTGGTAVEGELDLLAGGGGGGSVCSTGSGSGSGSTAAAASKRRPKLPLAMNRTVGVPTPVSTAVEAFGFAADQQQQQQHHHYQAQHLHPHPHQQQLLPLPLPGASASGPPSAAAALAAIAASSASSAPGLASAAASAPSAPMSHVQALLRAEGKLVVAMVGLPARGKTFIARHLKRHLGWMGYRVEIFNVGNYRRKHLGAVQRHDFFDPLNREGEAQRQLVAEMAFGEMVAYLRRDVVDVAIFDATNTTVERRQWLAASLGAAEPSARLVFVEPICTDEAIVRSNVVETKLKSPDYRGWEESTAVEDFLARIQHYVSVYQPLGESPLEENVPYIKLIDLGKQFVCNRITGYLNSRVMFFLFNLHVTSRPIWLTRHGESEFNVQGRIGGDSGLSLRGSAYAQRLAAFFSQHYPLGGDKELVVWTSTLRRTQLTAACLGRKIVAWKALDEIDAGVCDGLTYEAIAARWPEEYAQRSKSKFTYRYPRGESYADIVLRLEPLMVELCRQRSPVLIISHQATLRVLYAYLTDMAPAQCPEVLVPLHTVMQLTPKAYSAEEVRHELLPSVEASHK